MRIGNKEGEKNSYSLNSASEKKEDVELWAKLNMHSWATNRQDMFPAGGEKETIQNSCYTSL